MTAEQIEELTEQTIQMARMTHSSEIVFAEFAVFVRDELNQLSESEVQKDD